MNCRCGRPATEYGWRFDGRLYHRELLHCAECSWNEYANLGDSKVWERELAQGCEDRRVDMLDAYHSEGLKWKGKP